MESGRLEVKVNDIGSTAKRFVRGNLNEPDDTIYEITEVRVGLNHNFDFKKWDQGKKKLAGDIRNAEIISGNKIRIF